MAHQIDQSVRKQGHAAFAETPAWHRLGVVLAEAKNSAETMEAAGLGWYIHQSEVYCKVPGGVGENGEVIPDQEVVIPDRVANVRSDTGLPLAIVSRRYEVLQNVDAFAFLDSLVGTGDVRYESAGSLDGGRRIWALARLSTEGLETEVVEGDELLPYLCLSTSHDGSMAVRIAGTQTRVQCANTIAIVDRQSGNKVDLVQSFRHSRKINEHLEEVRTAIGLVTDGHRAYITAARALAGVQLAKNKNQMLEDDRAKQYLAALFPNLADPEASAAAQKRAENAVAQIIRNYHEQASCQSDGVRGTAWGLVNAVTYFWDHQAQAKGGNDVERMTSRFDSSLWGVNSERKVQAFQQAQQVLVGV